MAKQRSQSPASDCQAALPRQIDVASPEIIAAGIAENWGAPARLCTCCRCVYTEDGRSKTIRGFFDNAILGLGWKPINA
jgi:hypothetical protein